MKRLTYYLCGIALLLVGIMPLSAQTQWKDTIVVSRDGSAGRSHPQPLNQRNRRA